MKSATRARRLPSAGSTSGQRAVVLRERGGIRASRRSDLGSSAAGRSCERASRAGPLREPGRRERQPSPRPRRENVQQHPALKRVERLHRPARLQLGHVLAERLDELAVLHAGRAGRLTRPAIQAEVEVALDRVVELELAVDDVAHQVDAAAGAVGLVAVLDVRRARGGTEPAVDAVENQFVVDVRAVVGQDGEGGLRWRETNSKEVTIGRLAERPGGSPRRARDHESPRD